MTVEKHLNDFTGFEACIATVKSFFGNGDFKEAFIEANTGLKIVICMSLLIGNLLWLGHNAFLTSSLLQPMERPPFTSLESLLTTNYM